MRLTKEQLEKVIENSFNGDHVFIQQLVDHIQALEAENRWIGVDEKLPDEGKSVLTITDYGGQDVCRRREDEKGKSIWLNDMRPQHSNGGVTHWKPIAPPDR